MRARWIAYCTLAEALGIAGVAVGYAAAARGLVPQAPAVLISGLWEGLLLGSFQALVLVGLGIRPMPWVAVTALIAVFGYGGSLVAWPGVELTTADPPLWLLVSVAAGFGAILGLMMGALQAWAGGGTLPRVEWIWRTALGWALALPAIFLGAALVAPGSSLVLIGLIGAATGAVAGVLIGRATAPALPPGPQPA